MSGFQLVRSLDFANKLFITKHYIHISYLILTNKRDIHITIKKQANKIKRYTTQMFILLLYVYIKYICCKYFTSHYNFY